MHLLLQGTQSVEVNASHISSSGNNNNVSYLSSRSSAHSHPSPQTTTREHANANTSERLPSHATRASLSVLFTPSNDETTHSSTCLHPPIQLAQLADAKKQYKEAESALIVACARLRHARFRVVPHAACQTLECHESFVRAAREHLDTMKLCVRAD